MHACRSTLEDPTPTLRLNTAPLRVATYTGGSDTATLTFDYTVQAGDTSAGLDYAAVTSFLLNGATIRDVATNNAIRTLAAPGAAGSLGAAKQIVIDTTAPAAPGVTVPAAGSTTGPSVTPSISAEAGATLACTLDGAASSCAALTGLATGSHTLRVTATDAAGNTSPIGAATWTVDATPPDTLITSGPTDPTNQTSASFTLGATEAGSTAECSLDGAAFSACSATPTFSSLAEGPHTLQARAIDGYGNIDPTPASFSWTIDLTGPDAPTISGPADPSNEVSPAISFSTNEPGSTFECRLDGAAFASCTSPVSIGPLADGSHTFSVKATDPAGNAGSVANATWVVDTAAPDAPTFSTKPTSPSANASGEFGFVGAPASTFQCKLDAAATFTACPTPFTTPPLTEGSHTLQVVQVSAAGNVSSARSYSWTIDLSAPDAPTITETPAATSSSTTATFKFSSTEPGVAYECDVDSAGFGACASPHTLLALTIGFHNFSVRAVDAAGNVSAAAGYTWTVGASGPGAVPPHLVSVSPADGTTIPAVGPNVVVSFDRLVNVTNGFLQHEGDAPVSLPTTTGSSWTIPYASTAPGLYTITAKISDGITTMDVVTHFSIWVANQAAPAPATSVTAYPSSTTGVPVVGASLAASDGRATMTWPAGDVPSDGMIVKIEPKPALTAPSGATFSTGGAPIDVTAHSILNDTPITQFSEPISIDFPNAGPTDIPAWSTDGGATWHFLGELDSPALPEGRTDGFVRLGGTGVRVLTMHLTLYAILGDKQAPEAPGTVGGAVNNGSLVLRWDGANDNSGSIAYYAIWIDGKLVKKLGGSTFEYYVGQASTGDPHSYQVQAIDASGNEGPLSVAVVGVPNIVGMTKLQAASALRAVGLAVGAVTNPSSGGKVTAQTPAVPAYMLSGSAVDFTLDGGSALRTPLSLHVVGSHRINPLERRYVAARVQVNVASQIISTLRDPDGRIVARWTKDRRSGTFIIRYALPSNIPTGYYKLTVEAKSEGARQAYTIPVTVTRQSTPVLRNPQVVIVGDTSARTTLSVGSAIKAKVVVSAAGRVFDIAGASPDVAVIVVDVDANGLSMVHNLHIVFPSVKIVAVTSKHASVDRARRFGADAVAYSPQRQGADGLVTSLVNELLAKNRP